MMISLLIHLFFQIPLIILKPTSNEYFIYTYVFTIRFFTETFLKMSKTDVFIDMIIYFLLFMHRLYKISI